MTTIPSRLPPYCDANLSGSRVQLVPHSHIIFNGARIELPGENVIFLRLSPDGTRFAGVGHLSGSVWTWEGAWKRDGSCEGMSPVIYDSAGVLQIVRKSTGSNPTGAQGWRYVADDGRLVEAWKTYADPVRHIWEYTDRGDVTVGQGGDEEGLQVLIRGRRVLLQAGYVRNIQCYRAGDRIVIAAIKDALTPLFYDLTGAEIDALPTYVLPTPLPIPVPAPVPGPPAPAPVPQPTPPSEESVIPKITVTQYGASIIKGVPWEVDATIGDTEVVVRIAGDGNLTIRAKNPAGEDATGLKRHVEVGA